MHGRDHRTFPPMPAVRMARTVRYWQPGQPVSVFVSKCTRQLLVGQRRHSQRLPLLSRLIDVLKEEPFLMTVQFLPYPLLAPLVEGITPPARRRNYVFTDFRH
jgi:hypothetical protein